MANVLQDLLEQLRRVLADERHSLEKLDRAGIEFAADQKLELVEQINEARKGGAIAAGDRQLLEEISQHARTNHLLLVHARACVRGALALVQDQPVVEGPPIGRTTVAPPLALSVRG
jgi:hypothetical protein